MFGLIAPETGPTVSRTQHTSSVYPKLCMVYIAWETYLRQINHIDGYWVPFNILLFLKYLVNIIPHLLWLSGIQISIAVRDQESDNYAGKLVRSIVNHLKNIILQTGFSCSRKSIYLPKNHSHVVWMILVALVLIVHRDKIKVLSE